MKMEYLRPIRFELVKRSDTIKFQDVVPKKQTNVNEPKNSNACQAENKLSHMNNEHASERFSWVEFFFLSFS